MQMSIRIMNGHDPICMPGTGLVERRLFPYRHDDLCNAEEQMLRLLQSYNFSADKSTSQKSWEGFSWTSSSEFRTDRWRINQFALAWT